jgi:hypothetical protein
MNTALYFLPIISFSFLTEAYATTLPEIDSQELINKNAPYYAPLNEVIKPGSPKIYASKNQKIPREATKGKFTIQCLQEAEERLMHRELQVMERRDYLKKIEERLNKKGLKLDIQKAERIQRIQKERLNKKGQSLDTQKTKHQLLDAENNLMYRELDIIRIREDLEKETHNIKYKITSETKISRLQEKLNYANKISQLNLEKMKLSYEKENVINKLSRVEREIIDRERWDQERLEIEMKAREKAEKELKEAREKAEMGYMANLCLIQ